MRGFVIALFFLTAPAHTGWRSLGFDNDTVRSVSVHPSNPQIIFAATSSGLFRSADRGVSWEKVRNGFHYLVFDPIDSSKVYGLLSTGSRSDGIWFSADLGDSWELLFWAVFPTCLTFPLVGPTSMMLGTNGGGIYRSDDSGNTWSQFNNGLADIKVYALSYTNPTDSTPIPLAGAGNGIYYLTSAMEWKPCSAVELPARSIDGFHHLGPFYAALGAGSYSDGIYKSDDYGLTWQVSYWLVYPTAVVVNQQDSNVVYAADSGYGVGISRNGGESWTSLNEGLGNLVVLFLAQSPTDTGQLFAGTEDGLWVYEFSAAIADNKRKDVFQIQVPTVSLSPVKIRYCIPASKDNVEITIFDRRGARIVITAPSGSVGWHDETIAVGRSGVYFVRIKAGNEMVTRKIVVVKD